MPNVSLACLRPLSLVTARQRGTGLPRISEALRRYSQQRWRGGEFAVNNFQGNLRIAVDLRDKMGSRIFWFDAYSRGEPALLSKLLAPGDLFIDVGANIGEFTLVAARSVGNRGRIIAFEPLAFTRARLEANVARNGFHWVTIRQEALGEQEGQIELFSGDYRGELHVGLPTAFESDGRATLIGSAHQVRLDTLAADLELTKVSGIKLDIEGGELPAPARRGGDDSTFQALDDLRNRQGDVLGGRLRASGRLLVFQRVRVHAVYDWGGWRAPLYAKRRRLGGLAKRFRYHRSRTVS